MKDPRIVTNIKFTRRPKHTVPAMAIIRATAAKFDGLVTFEDLDELTFDNVTTANALTDELVKNFVDEVNQLADGTFILGSWRTRIEDLDDEPEDEEEPE
ncbi:MAG: hypothetical protein NUV56_01070 [Candidatus Uhrbacteria bacterium]|nr:hypothetical protein [Candidatus Uhrbacteria bacterium]